MGYWNVVLGSLHNTSCVGKNFKDHKKVSVVQIHNKSNRDIHRLFSFPFLLQVKENEILSGLTISEASFSVLEQGTCTKNQWMND